MARASRSRGSRRPTTGRCLRSPSGRAIPRTAAAASRAAGRAGVDRAMPRDRAPRCLLGFDFCGAHHLDPCPLLGAELPEPELPSFSSRTSSRDALSRSEARVSNSCRRPADMRWMTSASRPRPRPRTAFRGGVRPRRPAVQRTQRWVVGLQRIDARGERGLDAGTSDPGADETCSDLDLWELRHAPMSVLRAGTNAELRTALTESFAAVQHLFTNEEKDVGHERSTGNCRTH